MMYWKNASRGDQKRLKAISMVLAEYPWLIGQIFSEVEPSLKVSPQGAIRGRSSTEKVLIGLALDFWNSSGDIQVMQLDRLDSENFENVISTLRFLRTN